jgi:BlaI family transcriptional regulator, penicillinase repressor
MNFDNDLPELSRAEYDILHVLWKFGRATVREVHDQLQESTGWAYTTTKTMMDRMVTKSLLERNQFHGIYLYQPLVSRPQGIARWVKFFADRVLETTVHDVVSLFAKGNAITQEELDELTRLLEKDNKEDHSK